MGTAAGMLDLARQQVGYVEGPRNNQTKYGAWSGYNFQPWCGSFVNWCLHFSGTGGEPSVVWTPGGAQSYQRLGRAIPRNGEVRPGDVVFFDWGGSLLASNVDHVGIVEAPLPDGRIQTIEGNTSPSDFGSQSNGGGCYRRIRSRGTIAMFGRPLYAPDPASPWTPPPANVDWAALRRFVAAALRNDLRAVGTVKLGSRGKAVETVQKALNHVSGAALQADGSFGPQTHAAVVAFQKFFRLAGDGVVGPQTKAMLDLCLAKIAAGQ
jgi:hypothetical protein